MSEKTNREIARKAVGQATDKGLVADDYSANETQADLERELADIIERAIAEATKEQAKRIAELEAELAEQEHRSEWRSARIMTLEDDLEAASTAKKKAENDAASFAARLCLHPAMDQGGHFYCIRIIELTAQRDKAVGLVAAALETMKQRRDDEENCGLADADETGAWIDQAEALLSEVGPANPEPKTAEKE